MEQHDRNAQYHQNDAGHSIQRLCRGFIGKDCGDSGPNQREDHAENEYQRVRYATNGKVGNGAGEGVNAIINTLVPTAVFSS